MVHSQPIFDTTLEYWPETRRVTVLCVPSSPLPLPVLRPISVHAYLRACVCVPARVPRPAPISKIATPPPSDETSLYNRASPSIELNEIA